MRIPKPNGSKLMIAAGIALALGSFAGCNRTSALASIKKDQADAACSGNRIIQDVDNCSKLSAEAERSKNSAAAVWWFALRGVPFGIVIALVGLAELESGEPSKKAKLKHTCSSSNQPKLQS